jgi:hypothetical protein
MDNADIEQPQRYPVLALGDEELLKEIFSVLGKSISSVADPYSDDGSYTAAIASLPIGLRAMAATHHLDTSLTMDDIGWHFQLCPRVYANPQGRSCCKSSDGTS